MFAQLVHLKFPPENLEQIRKIYQEEVLPVVNRQRGKP
jgi:hypothetical protein